MKQDENGFVGTFEDQFPEGAYVAVPCKLTIELDYTNSRLRGMTPQEIVSAVKSFFIDELGNSAVFDVELSYKEVYLYRGEFV